MRAHPPEPRGAPAYSLFAQLAALLAVIAWLRLEGVTYFDFFGVGPSWAAEKAPWLLGVLGVGAGLRRLTGRKREVDLGLGLVCGAIAYPMYLAPLVILTAGSWAIVHFVGGRIGTKLAALAGLHLALAAAVWGLPQLGLRKLALVFVLMVFFRTLAYLQDCIKTGYAPRPLLSWLAGCLGGPSWVIHPYLVVIPPSTQPRRPRDELALLTDGLAQLKLGIVTLVVARLLFYGQQQLWPRTPAPALEWHLWSMLDMGVLLTYAAANAALLVGLLNVLGQDVKPAFRSPWFATSLFDYWGRFIIHYKDLQVALIYFPVVLTQRKRGARLAILMGVALTFMVGNNLFHLLGRYIYTQELFTGAPHAALQNLALTAVMAAALLWEDHKARLSSSARAATDISWGPVGPVVRVYFTLAVVSWIWHL